MTEKRMYKVKILEVFSNNVYDCYGEYSDTQSILYPATTDWEEVTHKELVKIHDAVRDANSFRRKKNKEGLFCVIQYDDEMNREVFKLASDFAAEQEKERLAQEARQKKLAKEKENKALARKRKQLEKLKEELGE